MSYSATVDCFGLNGGLHGWQSWSARNDVVDNVQYSQFRLNVGKGDGKSFESTVEMAIDQKTVDVHTEIILGQLITHFRLYFDTIEESWVLGNSTNSWIAPHSKSYHLSMLTQSCAVQV